MAVLWLAENDPKHKLGKLKAAKLSGFSISTMGRAIKLTATKK